MPSSSSVLTDFADDQLNREYLADYLTTFIRTTLPAVNTNSLVLALNSAWGSGKTSFIQMWINKLKKTNVAGTDTNTKSEDDEDVLEPKQEFNIIYYNAWENDSCPEANNLQIFLSSRLCFEDRNVELEMSQLKKITRQLSLSLRDLNVICLAYMKFLKAKSYLREI